MPGQIFKQGIRLGIKQTGSLFAARLHSDMLKSIAQFVHFLFHFGKIRLNRSGPQNPAFLTGHVFFDLFHILGHFVFVFDFGGSFHPQPVRTINQITAYQLYRTHQPGVFFGSFFLRNLHDDALPFGQLNLGQTVFLSVQESFKAVSEIDEKAFLVTRQHYFFADFSQINITADRLTAGNDFQFFGVAVLKQRNSGHSRIFIINDGICCHLIPAPFSKFCVSNSGSPTMPE